MQETQETQVQPLGREDTLEKEVATHPLQYSCLKNSMGRGAWKATVHGATKSRTRLSDKAIWLIGTRVQNPMDRGVWWAAVHGVAGSQTRLRDFTFHFHTLEREMATHSSVLAWRIPGTGEPGGLPSMGLHRVGHDWRNLAAAAECSTSARGLLFPYVSVNTWYSPSV